jgi:hypothetical protein
MKLFSGTRSNDLTRIDSDADHAVANVVDRRAQQKRVPHPPTHAGEPCSTQPSFLA